MVQTFDLQQRFAGRRFADTQGPDLEPLLALVGHHLVGDWRPRSRPAPCRIPTPVRPSAVPQSTLLSFSPPLATRCKGAHLLIQARATNNRGGRRSRKSVVAHRFGSISARNHPESRCLNRFRWLRPTDTYAMESWNPYHDTELYFDAPSPLSQSQILDAREMLGSATGHYQARTVRPSMQYFDCDLSFTEPLRTHRCCRKPCIVQMFDGQWRHTASTAASLISTTWAVLRCSAPASRWRPSISCRRAAARAWALRIAASYLEEEPETGDGALSAGAAKGRRRGFTQLSRCGAITALFERLYESIPRRPRTPARRA